MRCGHCKGEHGTVAEVRECSTKGQPDIDAIPEGYYAVKSLTGSNDIDFFRVDKPTKGQWEGWTFVTQIVGGDQHFKQRGNRKWDILRAIAAMGWEKSGELFAAETQHCYKCYTGLSKYASRILGIGPECAKKYGRWEEWSRIQKEFDAAAREDAKRERESANAQLALDPGEFTGVAVVKVPKGKNRSRSLARKVGNRQWPDSL